VLAIPDYGWDDVAEPTDAELAEVDAAMAAAPPIVQRFDSRKEWAQNAKVRIAIQQVGLPDSEPGWLERFTKVLFAITEAAAQLGVDELLEGMTQYKQLGDKAEHGGVQLHGRPHCTIIHKFLRAGLDIESTACVLGIDVQEVCRRLSPSHGLKLLDADRLLRRGDVPVAEIARQTGISQDRLIDYSKTCGVRTHSQIKHSRRATDECKARAVALGRAGHKTTAVLDQLTQEFPEQAPVLTWHAVQKWIKRAA
jgi:hypothetical protein